VSSSAPKNPFNKQTEAHHLFWLACRKNSTREPEDRTVFEGVLLLLDTSNAFERVCLYIRSAKRGPLAAHCSPALVAPGGVIIFCDMFSLTRHRAHMQQSSTHLSATTCIIKINFRRVRVAMMRNLKLCASVCERTHNLGGQMRPPGCSHLALRH
jgi:hypothetical protein